MPLVKQLEDALDRRQAKGMLRRLTSFEPRTISSTSSLADFSSNDYLSIATSQDLKARFMRRAEKMRVGGSTGSRLLDGNNGSGETEELENRLREHFESSDALLCPSGWEANVSLFSTLPQDGDVILYDSLIHASVHDGMRRSRAASFAFKHNDCSDFERVLASVVAGLSDKSNVFVAVEALYSMDGDFAPMTELVAIAHRYISQGSGRLWFIVDEAHSGGCYGQGGKGMCQEWGLSGSSELIRLVTFGKGFGSTGAVLLCPPVARQYLINYARPLIFSTSMPHTSLHLIHASLDIITSPSGSKRRQSMYDNCQLLRRELQTVLEGSGMVGQVDGLLAIDFDRSEEPAFDEVSPLRAVCNAAIVDDDSSTPIRASPIMPLLTPHHHTRPLAAYLQQAGFLVRPITYPTVPLGKDRIRICVHSENTKEEIRGLAQAVGKWVEAEQAKAKGLGRGRRQGESTRKESRL